MVIISQASAIVLAHIKNATCGNRSAWSRTGGNFPLCCESDISQEMIKEYKKEISTLSKKEEAISAYTTAPTKAVLDIINNLKIQFNNLLRNIQLYISSSNSISIIAVSIGKNEATISSYMNEAAKVNDIRNEIKDVKRDILV